MVCAFDIGFPPKYKLKKTSSEREKKKNSKLKTISIFL